MKHKVKYEKIGSHQRVIDKFENASTLLMFKKNVERFFCLWFSITHAHYLKL
jgi:hypothetical protein